jgi:hypothetical protein
LAGNSCAVATVVKINVTSNASSRLLLSPSITASLYLQRMKYEEKGGKGLMAIWGERTTFFILHPSAFIL